MLGGGVVIGRHAPPAADENMQASRTIDGALFLADESFPVYTSEHLVEKWVLDSIRERYSHTSERLRDAGVHSPLSFWGLIISHAPPDII